MRKGFGLIGILIVVALVAGMGVFMFDSVFPEKSPFTPSEEEKSAIDRADEIGGETSDDVNVSEVSPPNVDMTGWKTYRNEEYGFEIRYLKDLIVSEGVGYGGGNEFPIFFFKDPSYAEEGIPYEVGSITVIEGRSAIQDNRPSNYPYYPHTSTDYLSNEVLKTTKTPTLKAESVSINGMPATKYIYVNEGSSVFFYWIEHNDIALKINLDKYSLYPRNTKDYIDINSLRFN